MFDFTPSAGQICEHLIALSAKVNIIAVDGRSGSGKSTFANQLATYAHLSHRIQCTVVSMDDMYPGWDGLAEGISYAEECLVTPVRHGKSAHYRRFDWHQLRRVELVTVECGKLVILEGVGSSVLVEPSVWVDRSCHARRRAAFSRDFWQYPARWDQWAAQEEELGASGWGPMLCTAVTTPLDDSR